jgi:hypothetical protein
VFDEGPEGGLAVVKKASERPPAKAKAARRRAPKRPEINEDEEKILLAALKYLLFNQGSLLVPTDVREGPSTHPGTWVITVTLRYPTGHEGEVGELLYDGKDFTVLTPRDVWKARVKKIAEDPERQRKWDEYRASTLQAGEG